jgi:hypothetical protein
MADFGKDAVSAFCAFSGANTAIDFNTLRHRYAVAADPPQ